MLVEPIIHKEQKQNEEEEIYLANEELNACKYCCMRFKGS